MRLSLHTLFLVPLTLASVLADFTGPSYPAPHDLTSKKSLIPAAWKNTTAVLQKYIDSGNKSTTVSDGISSMWNVTFSVGMFSLHDPAATDLQFHYTSPEVANAANGTHKVDSDSIYRIASVTKVFTVLAGLLNLNETDWSRPLSDIVPALRDYSKKNPGEKDPVYTVEWDKITPLALSAQIGGVPRDAWPESDLLATAEIELVLGGDKQAVPDLIEEGFPPVPTNDPLAFPPCLVPTCGESQWIAGLEDRHPSFLPFTSPGYSDNGFASLGLAISHLTGKNMTQLYQESIFGPLGMSSSNSSTPPESLWYRSVIPGDYTNFDIDAGINVATGGLLSTTSDLAKLGLGILDSKLMSDAQTRRWLKPFSHTADIHYSVGRPWEIMRYVHPNGVVTDLYTKSGQSGAYSSWFVLLPDYDAGFSILGASTYTGILDIITTIADTVTDSILPAITEQAMAEVGSNYAGEYTSTVEGLNSSLTLTVNKTEGAAPGLAITSWISNGTDLIAPDGIFSSFLSLRAVPSIQAPETGKMAFRLVNTADPPSGNKAVSGLFSTFVDGDWIGVDAQQYGGIATHYLVFHVDCDGKAETVDLPAWRTTLKKSA
ncbi:beta-lactamase/transpeptidase-like protein [Rhizodiscina lignyota]|uniref:Beta-lactamase/transpeptidase-like protein n=1 Tax=Rhizodiscina lignyota TaxID=1504668 RepID=A0A9P4I730_9PEZI|nr:beta-lactamase/transpeptidase-like protein [Rhizodiscina lignyota]